MFQILYFSYKSTVVEIFLEACFNVCRPSYLRNINVQLRCIYWFTEGAFQDRSRVYLSINFFFGKVFLAFERTNGMGEYFFLKLLKSNFT